jgi:hypothetical protein
VASNRRRSLRKLNNYVNRIDRDVRRMSKRQSVTRLADASVGTPQLAEGAVTEDILDETIVTDISDANTNAETALTDAATALSTANSKNKIYRQTTEPTGGTYAEGDLWFDTDDDNKIYRYSPTPSPVWTGFTLGDSALASLSATKITAGTIDASVITVSNLDAGNITVGTLSGIAINTGAGATSFHVDALGRMFLGGTTFAAATFKVDSDGSFLASAGTIAGSIQVFDTGIMRTTQGLGFTTYGYDEAWSSERSGVFSDGDGIGFASFTYGDISIYETTYGGGSYSQMTSSGIYTNAITPATQSYVSFPGIEAGWNFPDLSYGANDPGWRVAFYATGDIASFGGAGGFSATATRISDDFPYAYTYLVGSGLASSDRRVKINIEEVNEDLEDKFLNQLKIYQFDRINLADDDDLHAYGKSYGVMADEIKEIFPQWESSHLLKDPDGADKDTIRSVDYGSMVPALVWICQRLNARIKELEDRLGA